VQYRNYPVEGVDSEPVLIDLQKDWNIDFDNPDSARPLACALIGMLLIIIIITMIINNGTKKKKHLFS
jgi:hypothetical protein